MVKKKKAADEISDLETENWFGHSYLNSFGFWGVVRGSNLNYLWGPGNTRGKDFCFDSATSHIFFMFYFDFESWCFNPDF